MRLTVIAFEQIRRHEGVTTGSRRYGRPPAPVDHACIESRDDVCRTAAARSPLTASSYMRPIRGISMEVPSGVDRPVAAEANAEAPYSELRCTIWLARLGRCEMKQEAREAGFSGFLLHATVMRQWSDSLLILKCRQRAARTAHSSGPNQSRTLRASSVVERFQMPGSIRSCTIERCLDEDLRAVAAAFWHIRFARPALKNVGRAGPSSRRSPPSSPAAPTAFPWPAEASIIWLVVGGLIVWCLLAMLTD